MLLLGGVPVTYFASSLTADDEEIHGYKIGSHRGQQAWESLTVLVAINAWREHWIAKRLTLCIKSDSKAALAMAERLKSGPSAKLISQELAIIYHEAAFEPRVQHIPGVANRLADALSRLNAPGSKKTLPKVLTDLPVTPIPPRGRSYYAMLATK